MRRPIFHGLILAIVLATAFYATFLPSRVSTRASGLVDPATGLSYSGAAVGRVPVEPQVSSQAVPQIATKSSFANPTTTGTSGGQSAGLLQNNPDARTSALGLASPGLAQPTAVASSMSAETTPSGDTPPPAASATPVATPAAVSQLCDTSHSTRYCVYTVQAGDSLGSIATKFPHIKGNPAEDLAPHDYLVNSNKPDIISEDDLLQIGQSLRIPVINGVVHTVITSQTLVEIATAYGVDPKDIAGVSVNGINNADQLTIGQELVIPNPKRFGAPAPAPTPTPTAVPTTAPSAAARSAAPADTAPAAAAKPATTSKSGFIWPVGGPISSYFGPSHPLGIDIDLYANPSAPIAAAAAGTVTFAGGSSCCSYGLYVIVDHGNGYSTLYAHLSKISVSVGQKVAQGAMLGNGGRTGYATGAHLHFEVHLNDAVINPMSVLP